MSASSVAPSAPTPEEGIRGVHRDRPEVEAPVIAASSKLPAKWVVWSPDDPALSGQPPPRGNEGGLGPASRPAEMPTAPVVPQRNPLQLAQQNPLPLPLPQQNGPGPASRPVEMPTAPVVPQRNPLRQAQQNPLPLPLPHQNLLPQLTIQGGQPMWPAFLWMPSMVQPWMMQPMQPAARPNAILPSKGLGPIAPQLRPAAPTGPPLQLEDPVREASERILENFRSGTVVWSTDAGSAEAAVADGSVAAALAAAAAGNLPPPTPPIPRPQDLVLNLANKGTILRAVEPFAEKLTKLGDKFAASVASLVVGSVHVSGGRVLGVSGRGKDREGSLVVLSDASAVDVIHRMLGDARSDREGGRGQEGLGEGGSKGGGPGGGGQGGGKRRRKEGSGAAECRPGGTTFPRNSGRPFEAVRDGRLPTSVPTPVAYAFRIREDGRAASEWERAAAVRAQGRANAALGRSQLPL